MVKNINHVNINRHATDWSDSAAPKYRKDAFWEHQPLNPGRQSRYNPSR